ncbi:hypothetical protein HHI36_017082 [Cryptolaemus montrouzieri]|uniref:Uncharacterized protein n=1 Tax=Cryptolaemus montrouzieri TaxID=559131 RepID=A0ABD2NMM4_9CUCU
MSDELSSLLNQYVNDISLISNGIINYNILQPETLYNELQKVSTKHSLPIPLTIENIFIPHTEDTTLFSYIEPDKPYIIISNNKYYYDYLDHLDNCLEFTPAKWLCKRISTIKKITLDIENCEVQLLNNNHMKNLPKSCKTKNFIAELEIWHKLKFNKWFYSVTFPTQLSIVCQDKSTVTERIDKLGILELQPNCKAFTSNVILEIETYIGTDELSNVLPLTNINQEDCCKHLKKNISLNGIKLEPIKLANLDLKELKYAQHKLSNSSIAIKDKDAGNSSIAIKDKDAGSMAHKNLQDVKKAFKYNKFIPKHMVIPQKTISCQHKLGNAFVVSKC